MRNLDKDWILNLNLAKHLDEKEQWINCLESVIMKVSQPRLQYFVSILNYLK